MTETDRNNVETVAEQIAENTAPAPDTTDETKTKRAPLIQINFGAGTEELHAKIIADAKTQGLPNATYVLQLIAKQYDFVIPEPSKSRNADTDGMTDEEKKAVKKAIADAKRAEEAEIRKQFADRLSDVAAKARADVLAKLRAPKAPETIHTIETVETPANTTTTEEPTA